MRVWRTAAPAALQPPPWRTPAVPYLFVLPSLIYLLLFWGYPAVTAFYLSLTDATFGSAPTHFVGLENFRRLLQDPVFRVALKNSGILLAASILIEVPVGLCIALYLASGPPPRSLARGAAGPAAGGVRPGTGEKRRRFAGVVIVALLLPWLFSEVVSAMTWRWIFHDPLGLLNALLRQAGLPSVPWLSRPATAMAALVTASTWQGIGISTMVLLAALQAVPSRLFDLAAIDGAEGWRRLLHVVLPQLKGVLLLDCMLVGIKSLGTFTLVFALTRGGPGYGTEVLATYIYRLTFSHYEPGYASAVAVCLAALFLALVALVYLFQRRPGAGYGGGPP